MAASSFHHPARRRRCTQGIGLNRFWEANGKQTEKNVLSKMGKIPIWLLIIVLLLLNTLSAYSLAAETPLPGSL